MKKIPSNKNIMTIINYSTQNHDKINIAPVWTDNFDEVNKD